MSRRLKLVRHQTSSVTPAIKIDVEVERNASVLAVAYVVVGEVGHVNLPQTTIPGRADGLWQHTCFEAFVRRAGASSYWELNFSPSLSWAAYRFTGYREGMAIESAISDPRVEMRSDQGETRFSARADLSRIAALPAQDVWQLGLSAVIEDQSGAKSYWALAHPLPKPDFHHAGNFILELPAE